MPLTKAEIDAVYDRVMEAVREYYTHPLLQKKEEVINFFRERGLDKYLAFPKSCVVPWVSPENNLILAGRSKNGYIVEV